MTVHHHSSGTGVRLAIRNLMLDQQLLALQPGQQVLYEDSYSYGNKTFDTQLSANLIQVYSLDTKIFTDTTNSMNSYLDKTIGEARTKFYLVFFISIILIFLTIGLWIVILAFIMFYMNYSHQKKQVEIKEEMSRMIKPLNTFELNSINIEWKLIHLSSGIVLRLVYSGIVNVSTPIQQQNVIIQQAYSPTVNQQVVIVQSEQEIQQTYSQPSTSSTTINQQAIEQSTPQDN